jgi:hypothetical protein
VHVTLTDLYPNVAALARISDVSGETITYHASSVDATRVPPELPGVRTLFSSFHHFRPNRARAVLHDAARSGTTIAIFEVTHRSLTAVLITLLAPLMVLLTTPAIRPFRWTRLFWTYVIPFIPLAALFDGVVSCLRTYTPGELLELASGIDGYEWETGEERARGPIPVTYLIGKRMDGRGP